MKRIEITLLVVIIIASCSFSQDYYPLPESDTYWQYSYNDIPQFCHCFGVCHHDRYSISGDTLINGTIYHKLNRSQLYYQYFCIETFYNAGYQGAFRNQAEEKKVWFVPPGEDIEVLLYDFDLQVGDTLQMNYIISSEHYVIDTIILEEVGNSYRKKFIIIDLWNPYEFPFEIIEGIGGQNLIRPIEEWYNFEAGYTFRCFKNGDTISYPSSCELIVSDNTEELPNNIEIFPNPTTGIFWIKHPDQNQRLISIEIFNSFGKKIYQPEPVNLRAAFDLSDQPKGLYFIRIKSETTNFTQKIIVE